LYLLETKVPFTVKDDAKVMFSPSIIAAIAAGWNAAKTALENYLNAAKNAAAIVIPTAPIITGNPIVTPKAGDPIVIPKAGDPVASQGDALARFRAKEAADLAADLAKKAAEAAIQGNALARFRAKEAADNAADIAAAAKTAADAVAAQANALAGFRAKEAADEAAYNASRAASNAQMDYDERFRFRAAQGVMASAGDSGFKGLMGGNTTQVTVNVAGTVVGTNDLVATVRQGLLAGQYNGQTLTLEAI